MKTDAIFYYIFKELPQIFFDLIGQTETNLNNYEFIAPEIKQTSFRLDGVFSPLKDFPEETIYFVEVQCYKDNEFYDRLFTSIFLYFSQYQPLNDNWLAIVIYDKRSNERPFPLRYRALLQPHLRHFYLDELEDISDDSLGLGIIKLIVETENKVEQLAKRLINQVEEEFSDTVTQQKVLKFIETIVIYKFPSLSREEIEAMFNLNIIKDTKVYQEAKEEGKLEIVPKLVNKGLSIQEIAEMLEIDVETVRKAVKGR